MQLSQRLKDLYVEVEEASDRGVVAYREALPILLKIVAAQCALLGVV